MASFSVRTEKDCRDSVVESRHKYLRIFRGSSYTPVGVYVVFLILEIIFSCLVVFPEVLCVWSVLRLMATGPEFL